MGLCSAEDSWGEYAITEMLRDRISVPFAVWLLDFELRSGMPIFAVGCGREIWCSMLEVVGRVSRILEISQR